VYGASVLATHEKGKRSKERGRIRRNATAVTVRSKNEPF
jgi:hypothetical protein